MLPVDSNQRKKRKKKKNKLIKIKHLLGLSSLEEDDADGDGGGLESSSGSRFEFISTKLRFRGILANSGEYIVKNNDQHDYKHKKCENPRKRFGNADRNSPVTAACRSSTQRE